MFASRMRSAAGCGLLALCLVGSSAVAHTTVKSQANICKATPPTVRPGKVNVWIPDNGSAFATEAVAHGVEGVGAPATLTVQRNLLSNPLDLSCGAGFDVTVTPSAAQVDRDLPIPRYWKLR